MAAMLWPMTLMLITLLPMSSQGRLGSPTVALPEFIPGMADMGLSCRAARPGMAQIRMMATKWMMRMMVQHRRARESRDRVRDGAVNGGAKSNIARKYAAGIWGRHIHLVLQKWPASIPVDRIWSLSLFGR